MENIPFIFSEGRCVYCRASFVGKSWCSAWDAGNHYKALQCSCGKENWLRVHVDGSGHDTIMAGKESPLGSVIRRVMEG